MTRHAVVIGASMAGLCAARVLARSFDKVIVLDRDELPDGTELRAGVPQGRHVHALITRGAHELERLYPGFLDEYRRLGANELDVTRDGAVLRGCGWQRPMASGQPVYFATRGLTESIVRRRTLASPQIELHTRCEVAGLLVRDDEPARVRGVRVQWRGQASGPSEFAADLVVDASGRSSKAPEWLAALGRPAPREDQVDAGTGYSSRWYEADPARRPADYWWRLVWLDPAPPEQLMGGVLFPVEDGKFIVTLIGYSRHYPPSDEEGFDRALHQQLRSPVLARTVAAARPISSVYSYRGLVNRLRRFDELEGPAPGFVALGDSVCTFNPMYGQGMTIATLCVAALEATLERIPGDDPGFPRAFFKAQAKNVRDAWALATAADGLFPGTRSEQPPPSRFARFFSEAIRMGMNTDREILRRVTPIYYLLRSTGELFDRRFMARLMAVGVREHALRALRRGAYAEMPPPRPLEDR